MAHISKMSILEYITFIAKSLISFITMIFSKPLQSIKTPEHLFALGHLIIIFAILIPS